MKNKLGYFLVLMMIVCLLAFVFVLLQRDSEPKLVREHLTERHYGWDSTAFYVPDTIHVDSGWVTAAPIYTVGWPKTSLTDSVSFYFEKHGAVFFTYEEILSMEHRTSTQFLRLVFVFDWSSHPADSTMEAYLHDEVMSLKGREWWSK